MGYTVDVQSRVARVTLDAPPLNVLTTALQTSLGAEIARLNERTDFNVLVIGSSLSAFSAGADVREHAGRENVAAMLKAAHGLIAALLDCPVPTLAAVNGTCLGGAFELALACDGIIARQNAKLGFPEISLAGFPPAGLVLGAWKLPPLLESELVTRGESLTAHELAARGAGIAAVPDGEFDARISATCARYASLSRAALVETTRLLRPGAAARFVAQVGPVETAYLERILPSPDAAEGVKAFLEKRPPKWV
ncbi:cyclohexa-1,5-dienecarbonyl-CoA hydratase [Planctomycetaceae bacterium]|nr:cyclohexa-1,5-dienecarbonyl-CoA hydratase [Planctomycetaceae bacterium]